MKALNCVRIKLIGYILHAFSLCILWENEIRSIYKIIIMNNIKKKKKIHFP